MPDAADAVDNLGAKARSASGSRGWRVALELYLKGAAIGSSDLVPGFSGGTMALVLGVYQPLLDAIGGFTRSAFWRQLARGNLRAALASVNAAFLLLLAAGLISALLLLSPLVSFLLKQFPTLVAAFFFGLVLASTLVAGRRVRRWGALPALLTLLGAVGAFVLVGLTPAQTPGGAPFLVLAGALAVCALVLPGLSGAFVLVLIGKYDVALAAVSTLDFSVLVPLGLGAAIGLLSFARLLVFMLRHHHDAILALLTGFIFGSLRKVWPYLSPGATPTWPWSALDSNAWLVTALVLLGCFAVIFLERTGAAKERSS